MNSDFNLPFDICIQNLCNAATAGAPDSALRPAAAQAVANSGGARAERSARTPRRLRERHHESHLRLIALFDADTRSIATAISSRRPAPSRSTRHPTLCDPLAGAGDGARRPLAAVEAAAVGAERTRGSRPESRNGLNSTSTRYLSVAVSAGE